MTVKRIGANVVADKIESAKAFYGGALRMAVVMDMEWITTFASDRRAAAPQISEATEGGSGTAVPDISVEMDDLAMVNRRMQTAGFTIEYGPVTEPWA
jgi:predicted enzyme related to lactoylglutathione lyase